jgi:hypothetical protein
VGLPRQHARGQRVIGGWARWGWSVKPLLQHDNQPCRFPSLQISTGLEPQLATVHSFSTLFPASRPLHGLAFRVRSRLGFSARPRCVQISSEVGERS